MQRIAKELNDAGIPAAKEILDTMPEIYKANRDYTVRKLSKDVTARFDIYDKRQIEILLKDTQPAFSKIAYKHLGANPAIVRRLQNEMAQATVLGESQTKIIERIRKVTGQSEYQAKRVAQTERVRIQSQARYDGLKEGEAIGLDVTKEWSARMVNTRESHAALNGTVIKVSEKFRTIWGNELEYPGDPSAPAEEVINCHCVLIPDVKINKKQETDWDYDLVNPNAIKPVNEITDKDKFAVLANEFEENGCVGRPILAITGDGDEYFALTGSHRIYAAREAGINIPTHTIQYTDSVKQLMAATDDSERLEVALNLRGKGLLDDQTVDLLRIENKNNNLAAARDYASEAAKIRKAQAEAEEAYQIELKKIEEDKAKKKPFAAESPEMKEYLAFKAEMVNKYGGENKIWVEMTDAEMDKLDRLSRAAYRK